MCVTRTSFGDLESLLLLVPITSLKLTIGHVLGKETKPFKEQTEGLTWRTFHTTEPPGMGCSRENQVSAAPREPVTLSWVDVMPSVPQPRLIVPPHFLHFQTAIQNVS